MKPLYKSIVLALVIAGAHYLLLIQTGGLWNISFISLSGLIAGILQAWPSRLSDPGQRLLS